MVSPDGYWRWDGTNWVPNTTAPAAAQAPTTSPDGLWMWNGAQWVPNTYQAVAPYASADLRATLTTIFIAINVVGVLLFIAFDILDATNISQGDPQEGGLYFAAGATAFLSLITYYGSFIAAVVFFCMWLHRIVRNMPSLGAPDPSFSPTVAVVLSFVPFMNLVQPLLSIIDAWRASPTDRRWLDRSARRSVRIPILIVGWWAAWLISRLVTWAGALVSISNGGEGYKIAGLVIDAVGDVLLIAAAALAILVVRRLTARQDARNQLIVSGQIA